MVSINRERSTGGSGVFFSRSSINLEETTSDTHCLLQPVIGSENIKKFTPLNTIYAATMLLILAVAMEAVVVSLLIWPPDLGKCAPYFLTLYSHIIYWAFSFVIDFYFKRKHHESRVRGYLEMYQQSQYHSRIPFYVVTIWNTMLLLIAALFHDQYGDLNEHCNAVHGLLTPINYMCFIITLENLVMVPVILSYIVKVSTFNRSQACPDAQRDDWMASFIQDSYSSGEVGYRERDNYVEDLLEKQADLLRYLKEQNTRLIQKVLILSTQLREKHDAQIT